MGNQAAATIQDLARDSILCTRRFMTGAIISDSEIDGWNALASHVIVEWDGKKVYFTRMRPDHNELAAERVKHGLESWYGAFGLIPKHFFGDWRQAHDGSPEMGSLNAHMQRANVEAQKIVIEAAREAQRILQSAKEIDSDVKAAVLKALGIEANEE